MILPPYKVCEYSMIQRGVVVGVAVTILVKKYIRLKGSNLADIKMHAKVIAWITACSI